LKNTKSVHVIDSHTGGEPTRVVLEGGPSLGDSSLTDRVSTFKTQYDHLRSAIVNEPRGSDAMVGALLCEPADKTCTTGVIFFNNVGYLGMCGHGTIGLVVTLAYLGKIQPGIHRIETPVGVVEAELLSSGEVAVANVPAYRLATDVSIHLAAFGRVTGDIAWGGNWFFLTADKPVPIALTHVDRLTDFAWQIRQELTAKNITGANGAEIDHIELFGEPSDSRAHSRNFVLCPGKSYDRSPCGTGTSAKLACLHAAGKLREGDVWIQESITGSIFEGSIAIKNGLVHPRIKGTAFVNADAHLIFDESDPLRWGIRPMPGSGQATPLEI
jgi:4-hydroxyproline epimerase